MKIGVVVVFYNPTTEQREYWENLSRHSCVFVVDNSPSAVTAGWKSKSFESDRLIFGENLGIATALNRGMERAFDSGCDWLFTFDQDSEIHELFISKMIDFALKCSRKDTMILFCPNYFDRNSKTYANFTSLKRFTYRTFQADRSLEHPVRATFAISSGSLFTSALFDRVGKFRDDYFIDHVDTEWCLRLWKLNGYVLVNPSVCIEHAIGEREVRRLFLLTIKPNNHPPLRRYYIVRNGLAAVLVYGVAYPSFAILSFNRLVHEVLSVVFFEKQKIAKINSMLRGGFHFVTGRMGKLS